MIFLIVPKWVIWEQSDVGKTHILLSKLNFNIEQNILDVTLVKLGR